MHAAHIREPRLELIATNNFEGIRLLAILWLYRISSNFVITHMQTSLFLNLVSLEKLKIIQTYSSTCKGLEKCLGLGLSTFRSRSRLSVSDPKSKSLGLGLVKSRKVSVSSRVGSQTSRSRISTSRLHPCFFGNSQFRVHIRAKNYESWLAVDKIIAIRLILAHHVGFSLDWNLEEWGVTR